MIRLPGWLAFLIFFPIQVYLAVKLWASDWAWWLIVLTLMVFGILGNRASRVPWIQHMLFPNVAAQREARRHVYQGILFLVAALLFLFPWGPRVTVFSWVAPILALLSLVTLLKASLR